MTTNCPTMKAFDKNGKITNVYCGKWSCKRCGKVNSKMWAWRVRIQIQDAQGRAYFWTITLGSRYKTARQGFAALPKLFDTFRKMVQRKVGKWTYCAFVEGQPKRGNMPHLHIISMSPAPIRIKDLAARAGFGYMADEQPITDKRAANYVAKYTSKGFEEAPPKFRRVRTSRDWAKLPDFIGFPLYVKSKAETLTHYLMRVADATGASVQDLYEQWMHARELDIETDIDTD